MTHFINVEKYFKVLEHLHLALLSNFKMFLTHNHSSAKASLETSEFQFLCSFLQAECDVATRYFILLLDAVFEIIRH